MTAFARLLSLAEFRTATLITGAVESVVGPIRAKSQEIVGEVIDTATSTLKTVLIKAGIGLFAVVMLIVAVVYLLSSLYFVLLPHFGPVESRLIMGGAFALLAVVAVAVVVLWPASRSKTPSAAKTAPARIEGAAAEARQTATDTASAAREGVAAKANVVAEPSDVKAGFEAIVSALGDAGFRREQAGLRAGLALAGQLKPAQIVSLALIGGFVAGLRRRRRR